VNPPASCELGSVGLIEVTGADAASFLHAQLTSDLAALAVPGSQYSGYCTPKGRMLASFLVWRLPGRVLLQMPADLVEPVRARLAKYVLRASVTLRDASRDFTLFGVFGDGAAAAAHDCAGHAPEAVHNVWEADGRAVARLPGERFVICAPAEESAALRARLQAAARAGPESAWALGDIECGVPWVTAQSQDLYVPQMLNLDLIGAVSYSKGCYPGQEIVARAHYLGRVKQRMQRVHVPSEEAPATGDGLFSPVFGDAQACGTLVNAAPSPAGGHEALAVIHGNALESEMRWRSPTGPRVSRLPLPYTVPV
jgi:tRNA-modifying protein YgfZ